MQDWITWGWRLLVVGLIGIVFFWIKRWIAKQDKRDEEWEKQGGVITRDMFFAWCKDMQGKCPACGGYRFLMDWRNGLLDRGGVMARTEIADLLGEKLCSEFDHHREVMGAELKLIRSEINLVRSDLSKNILEAMTNMKEAILDEVKQR